MRQDKVIYLITVTVTGETGSETETLTERKVFANELSVGSGEFYNAAMTGLRPEKRFEIYTREYQGEERLKHDNIMYRIIRTGPGKVPEKTQLTCERVAADG